MRKHSLMQRRFVLPTLVFTALLAGVACSNYDGTERWEGVYLPESEIDRPKGVMMMPMDAGRPDGGAGEGGAADGATAAGDAAAVDAGSTSDAGSTDAGASDAASGDAMSGDAMSSDAAPADATPAG